MDNQALKSLVVFAAKATSDKWAAALDRVNDDRMALLAGLNRLADHCANDAAALRIIEETLNAVVVTPGQR